MSRRVSIRVCSRAAVLLTAFASLALPSRAAAQSTVVLDEPHSEIADTTVRGGTYASTNFDTGVLVTRSSYYAEYVRRALLKFDTHSRIPAKATIQSATLTLTVKRGNDDTRVGVYRIEEPFDPEEATWENRTEDEEWRSDGGDVGEKYAEATVKAAAGSKATFNVTALVQEIVSGSGSRWTRMALIDLGRPSYLTYHEYYSSEASEATLRPVLTVTYATSSSTVPPVVPGTPPPSPTPTPKPVQTPTPLPAGWAASDIGRVGGKGATTYEAGTFAIAGAGADIWNSSDEFHFAYRKLEGDGTIAAKVDTLEQLDAWSKAGVMMRETLASDSRYVFMLVSAGEGLAFQRRSAPGDRSEQTGAGGGSAPYFVKLDRTGDTFTAFASKDGSTWKLVGRSTIAMGNTIYVGLAVTSHVDGVVATATFEDAAVQARGTPPPPSDDPDDGDDDDSAPPPDSRSSKTLRLLHWNSYHGGRRTDGVYDPNGFVSWLVKFNPDVITLNEIDTVDQANTILARLKAKMPGVPWTSYYLGRMKGNMILSRLPMTSTSRCVVNAGADRQVAHVGVLLNGRTINIWNAHLALSSSRVRTAETRALQACQRNWPEARIAAGDYNMQAGSDEYDSMTEDHTDAWRSAKAMGKATNYPGNCDGCTRRSRIDYVFTSKGASWLKLKSAQVMDTRNSRGVMASDHKPMLVVYDVQ